MILEKKAPIASITGLNLNVVLLVSRRKSSKIFIYGTFSSYIFHESFIEVP